MPLQAWALKELRSWFQFSICSFEIELKAYLRVLIAVEKQERTYFLSTEATIASGSVYRK
jgi:hypothetical protein